MLEHFSEEDILSMIVVDGEEIEDYDLMTDFINYLSAFITYEELVKFTSSWRDLNEIKQVEVAMKNVDDEDASRFMILLDYMSDRLHTGENE